VAALPRHWGRGTRRYKIRLHHRRKSRGSISIRDGFIGGGPPLLKWVPSGRHTRVKNNKAFLARLKGEEGLYPRGPEAGHAVQTR
jgi:hypothetical protein